MYFDHNVPKEAPPYIHKDMAGAMTAVFSRIRRRMEKLEEALDISGLDGATFSEYAKILFDTRFDRFESMLPDEMAEYVLVVSDGKHQAVPRMDWPNAVVLADTNFLTTKEWEMLRHLGIGGSDAAVTMGASAYKTRFDLFHDKCCTPKWKKKDRKQVIFDRGHTMEPKVIQTFCDLVGAEVIPESRMFVSIDYPCAIADIDAIIRFPGGQLYVFEAKTTISENYEAWAGDKIPGTYIPQIRHYPAVLNDDRILGSYIGCLFTVDYALHGMYIGSDTNVGQFVSRLVPRSKTEEKMLLETEEQFFEQHILTGEEPPLDGNPKDDMQRLMELTGPVDKEIAPILLDPTFEENIATYMDLQKKKKSLADQERSIKEAIDAAALPLIQVLGQGVEGRLPVPDSQDNEYWEVRYAPRSKTTIDQEILKHKYPEAYKECVTTDPCSCRVFSVKIKKDKTCR